MMSTDAQRDQVEELAAEFADRLRLGECPSVEEYAARCPERADEIRELFPAIVMMERAKAQKRRASDGKASLGGGRPERLGDYRIVREIGRGGMGIVYEAEQESLGRKVAVKVLPRPALLARGQLERFLREARTVARLHHTHIVPVFGVGEQDGLHYFVMQLIPGVGLDEVLDFLAGSRGRGKEGGPDQERRRLTSEVARALLSTLKPLSSPDWTAEEGNCPTDDAPTDEEPLVATQEGAEAASESQVLPVPEAGPGPLRDKGYWRQVARIGIQAAGALQEAHNQGVLHRDIKPANLLLTPGGQVWISDFGLAKVLETDAASSSGDLVGTLPYMAPELFDGRCDVRSDVYALGLTLYELLTFTPGYRDSDRNRLIRRITEGDLAPPRRVCPNIPLDLETIVLKAVSPDPDHRYASAREVADELRRFLDQRPVKARPLGVAGRLWRWSQRYPTVARLTLVVAVLLLMVTGVSMAGFVYTRRAWEGEMRQRERAETAAFTALEALDRTFNRFAPRDAGTPTGGAMEGPGGEMIPMPSAPAISRETASFLEELLGYYDRLAQQGAEYGRFHQAAARANLRVGDIHQRLGRPESALTAYHRALKVYEEMAQKAGEGAFRVERALIHNECGKVYRLMAHLAESQQAHKEALRLLEGVVAERAGGSKVEHPSAESQAPETRFELARTYFLLGQRPPRDLTLMIPYRLMSPMIPGKVSGPRSGDRTGGLPPGPLAATPNLDEQSARYLRRAEELLTGLTNRYPSVPAYRLLLACCLRERSSRLNSPARQQAIDILRRLSEEFTWVPEYRHALGETLANFDIGRPPYGDLGTPAANELRTALGEIDRLRSQYPGVPSYATTQVQIRHKLAVVLSLLGQPAEAQVLLQKALEVQKALVEEFPTTSTHRIWLAMLQQSLASVMMQKGDAAKGCDLLARAVADLAMIVKSDPHGRRLEPLLKESYERLEQGYKQINDHKRAAEARRAAETHIIRWATQMGRHPR
jgi:serine/threonine protein kinase/tetratricopeptide (TPR) repeat protein